MKKFVLSLVLAPFSLSAVDCPNLTQIKANMPLIKDVFAGDTHEVTVSGKNYTLTRGPEGKVIDDFLNDEFDGYQIYRVAKKDGTPLCKYVVYDPKTHARGSFLLNDVK